MDAATSGRSHGTLSVRPRHALAGLEAGILGALAFCGLLMLGSIWMRRSIWTGPNLFATLLWGQDAYVSAFRRTTPAGVAVVLLIYGSLGALWGMLLRDTQTPLLRWIGMAAGLAVYAFFFHFLWPRTNPLMVIYAPLRQMQAAHILWGLMLASSPRFSRNIARATGSPPPLPPTSGHFGSGQTDSAQPPFPSGAEAIRSGEITL